MKLSYSFLAVSHIVFNAVSEEVGNTRLSFVVFLPYLLKPCSSSREQNLAISWPLHSAGSGYSIRVHGTTGFIRKSVLSIALLPGSVLLGWDILNQPAGRKLGFSEICHEFRLPSIHPRSLLRLLPLTISLLPEGPRRTFRGNSCWWNCLDPAANLLFNTLTVEWVLCLFLEITIDCSEHVIILI